jgi:hypothetical protein
VITRTFTLEDVGGGLFLGGLNVGKFTDQWNWARPWLLSGVEMLVPGRSLEARRWGFCNCMLALVLL